MSVPIIPLSVLFTPAERDHPRVSPDGTRIAWLAPVDGIQNVWVAEPGSDDGKPVTSDTVRPIRSFFWAEDDRHLLYLQDTGGDENWHLFAVDVATGDVRDLTPFERVSAQLIGLAAAEPGTALVGLNKDDPSRHDAYRLDIASGELTLVSDYVGALAYAHDAHLRVLAALCIRPDGGSDLVTRASEQDPFRVVASWSMDDVRLVNAGLSLSADGSLVRMLSAADAETVRLVELDPRDGSVVRVLAADPAYDVTGYVGDPVTQDPLLASVSRERVHLIPLAPSSQDDIDALASFHPGDPTVLSADRANSKWTVRYTADDGPNASFLYDRQTRQATLLFVDKPRLTDYTLARQEPFHVMAADGLTVHGYLTFPPGEPRENLPTVLWVHGGPWARDEWGFQPIPQLLANRGYLTVQVNYRGSTGYGKQFLRAGDREWAGKMHSDLTDVVEHLVATGTADRSRVAIAGGSYGGYAALVGATFTPDVFACAVDVVGPSNLLTLLNSFPAYWGPTLGMWHARVGHPEQDKDFLWSRSPLSRVDQICIPMLVIQGANDPRVVKAESDQIVAAMKEKGLPHEYIVFPDEGHGFARPDNLMRYVRAMETFLGEHLGGRVEAEA